MGKLREKVAVIAGGTEGIGLATARLFVIKGSHVFITGRRQKELDEAVTAIGSNATGVQGDVAELADLDRRQGCKNNSEGRNPAQVAFRMFHSAPSPRSSLRNRISPSTSPLGNHLTWPFRIMCTTSYP